MKSFWTILILTLMSALLLASDGPTPDATAQFLWPDRIRNVIAVNDADQQSFFAATFGLDNYIVSNTPSTPLGKVAVVLRFTVFNSTYLWRIENRTHVYMQQDNLDLAEDCISSHNSVDIINIPIPPPLLVMQFFKMAL